MRRELPPSEDQTQGWTVEDALSLYRVPDWSGGYFTINAEGHVAVRPEGEPSRELDLKRLVDELGQRGIERPMLLRFTDVLGHRLRALHAAFASAIEDLQFQGGYRAVYPIKVNQQRHVVEEILDFGGSLDLGLEAGSKPELLAVLAMTQDDRTPIICNGFKDDEFIEAVILATKLGKTVIPVVEKFSELQLIVKHARNHDVRPQIGVRVKLASRGSGRWEHSAGDRSKFGLFISELTEALDYLRECDMLDCLAMVHCHLGSQITDIRNVKSGVTELSRIYVELHRAGAGMRMIDVGGGLGVDYDGSNTSAESSINYTLQEYANDVVFHIRETCDAAGVPHPSIITESGRAMVAYHSVLVFDVCGWSGHVRPAAPGTLSLRTDSPLPHPVRVLHDTLEEMTTKNLMEYFHDAQQARSEVLSLFNLGYCSLSDRGLAERLYHAICVRAQELGRTLDDPPDEIVDLDDWLARTYFCNFSIFQSLPDAWAIDQLFPIMPLHRLNEPPVCRGILADITCDSDGAIDRFIGARKPARVLELHPYDEEQPYLLGAFLVGAYQEILGDMHNLFGDTNAVHISVDENGHASIDEVIEGDTVREVLSYVQYQADSLQRLMRRRIERAVREGRISLDESRRLTHFYESGLAGYTYLE